MDSPYDPRIDPRSPREREPNKRALWPRSRMPIMDCISDGHFSAMVVEFPCSLSRNSFPILMSLGKRKNCFGRLPARIDWIGRGRRQCSISDSASAKAIVVLAPRRRRSEQRRRRRIVPYQSTEAFCWHSVSEWTQFHSAILICASESFAKKSYIHMTRNVARVAMPCQKAPAKVFFRT